MDKHGLPVTCAIDMMDNDESSLYFLTAKGKNFYNRLIEQGNIALTGMKGEDTMSCVAISVRGKVRELGADCLEKLFAKNPYMAEIYPTKESRKALTVFQIYDGSGEWFDLSVKPIQRADFFFGTITAMREGFQITDACIGCRACKSVCPQNCIDFSTLPATIKQENCLHCGNCLTGCPQQAVIKEG